MPSANPSDPPPPPGSSSEGRLAESAREQDAIVDSASDLTGVPEVGEGGLRRRAPGPIARELKRHGIS